MKTRLVCLSLPLLFAACANEHHHTAAVTRSSSETLRSRPAHVYAGSSSVRTARLNYPRPGEFRSYGTVEVASNAYVPSGELPPPIADFDPGADTGAGYVQHTQVVGVETPMNVGRTVIRNDGSVAMDTYRLTPLGPQGTNRAVINQVTGLPVDR